MVVRRNEDWGRRGQPPDGAVEVADDRAASAVVAAARAAGEAIPPIVLLGGDLCRSLGGRGDRQRMREGEAAIVRCDIGVVDHGSERSYFVAHAVVRRRFWAGEFAVVMNCAFLGSWNVAPRAHPGDGVLDLVTGRLVWRDRLQARQRAPSGTHLPHPGLSYRRSRSIELDVGPRDRVIVDGIRVASAPHLRLTVEPDALTVVV